MFNRKLLIRSVGTACVLTVKVHNQFDSPLNGVAVRLTKADGIRIDNTTNASGLATFEELPWGTTVTVQVSYNGYISQSHNIELKDAINLLTVTLSPTTDYAMKIAVSDILSPMFRTVEAGYIYGNSSSSLSPATLGGYTIRSFSGTNLWDANTGNIMNCVLYLSLLGSTSGTISTIYATINGVQYTLPYVGLVDGTYSGYRVGFSGSNPPLDYLYAHSGQTVTVKITY